MNDVSWYDVKLLDFRNTQKRKGDLDKETQKKLEELKNTFKSLSGGIQKKIQNDVDVYYKYLEEPSFLELLAKYSIKIKNILKI